MADTSVDSRSPRRAALSEPAGSSGEEPRLTAAERHRILVEWNDTRRDYPRDQCVHHLFEEQSARTPDAVAAVFEDRRLTYSELNARANRLARHLRRRGVGSETLVGICVERSLEMIVGLLGILKAGGAYVPLDPSYPRERLALMLADAAVPVVLTQRLLRSSVDRPESVVVELDHDVDLWSVEDGANLGAIDAASDSLCHVIYTSGSTGRPKGVLSTHRGLRNRLLWMQEAYGLGPDDRVLQKTPFGFDVSVWELFWPLVTGAALVLERPGEHRNPASLVESIQRFAISTIHFVPSMLDAFLEQPGIERCVSLKRVFCSGEALALRTQLQFFKRLGCELHNLYGPTEASIDVTYWRCDPHSAQPTIPIGRPIANTQIYILDEDRNPVPIGTAGELYIGGDGLARGYLNRPELTAEKFVSNPFSEELGSRLYRTGDLARYLVDGNIEFRGRIDHQVKIRGFRVEPGEIEATLATYPGVRQALVLAREDNPGDQRLVAYVVASAPEPTADALRGHLERKLPEYMVPSAFVILESLPLTPNGKIDRRAFAAPGYVDFQGESLLVAPRTATERALAEIWVEVLRLPRVGIHDNFFHLGGHSLLAMRVISRIRHALGVELPLRLLFESPTIEAIGRTLDEVGQSNAGRQYPPLTRVPRDGSFPLSFGQERLWFLDQFLADPAVYNVPFEVRLDGPLDVPSLERALNFVVERHESLRTTIQFIDGDLRQQVAPSLRVQLALDELGDSGNGESERYQRLVRDAARAPFDLARGPLLRALLLALAPERHVLALTLHHIVFDGWSIDVLFGELFEAYEASLSGASPSWPDLPFQYGDYAVWFRQCLNDEVLSGEISHWKDHLAGAPEFLPLPYDRPRPVIARCPGARHSQVLPGSLLEALESLGRHHGATLFMTLLAAFAELLRRYSGHHDLVIGTAVAGRRHLGLERIIGFFVNTLALRVDLSGDPTVLELLQRVRERTLDAQTHQDLPFEKLVEALNPVRTTGHSPLLQVLLVLENARDRLVTASRLSVRYEEVGTATSKVDLTFICGYSDGHFHVIVEYNTDLFDPATIQRMSLQFERLLNEMAAHPETRVSELGRS